MILDIDGTITSAILESLIGKSLNNLPIVWTTDFGELPLVTAS